MSADPNGISNQAVQRKLKAMFGDEIPKTVPVDDARHVAENKLPEPWDRIRELELIILMDGGNVARQRLAVKQEQWFRADRSHSQTPSYARAVDTPPMRTAIDIWAKLEAIETLVRETHAMVNGRGYIHRAP